MCASVHACACVHACVCVHMYMYVHTLYMYVHVYMYIVVAVYSQDSMRLAHVQMLSWLCTATILLEVSKQKTCTCITCA